MNKQIDIEQILKKIKSTTPMLVEGYFVQNKNLVVLNAFKAFIDLETAMTDYYNTNQLGLSTGSDYFYSGHLQQCQVEITLQLIRLALKPANLISADVTYLLENMQDYISINYCGKVLGQD